MILIVVNTITFSITEMGAECDGWLLTYGHGLHPLEWVAYNFLHFGFVHLLGNMFFLWAFGIVVEGKLGWLKFLLLYLGIGILGGAMIQTAMLGYVPEEPVEGVQAGAGGASLIIYGLIAIVLIWAPRNEIHCLWIFISRAGTFEVEYLYFCGFYIVTELVSAIFSVRGFEVSSEVGHLIGAVVGTGLGILFVKQNWVDCENWDLFSIISGKHDAAARVGSWQDNYAIPRVRRGKYEQTLTERSFQDDEPANPRKKKKKAKPKPKLVELGSFDDDDSGSGFDSLSDGQTANDDDASKPPSASRTGKKAKQDPKRQIAELISSGQFKAAANEYLEWMSFDTDFHLEQNVLLQLADGLYKAKENSQAAKFLEEYVRRFPAKAALQRVKLSILYIKYQRRPGAALKLLAKVDPKSLEEDFQAIHAKAVREAQKMISDGVTDESH